MRKRISTFVSRCRICHFHAMNVALYMSLLIPNQPWMDIRMDFALGLTCLMYTKRVMYLCMLWGIIFLWWPILFHERRQHMQLMLQPYFFQEFNGLHGLPKAIALCPDTRFLSHFWRILWKLVHTQFDFSSSYQPHIDSRTEVGNCSLGKVLHNLAVKRVSHGI